jgi:hypothetical protein
MPKISDKTFKELARLIDDVISLNKIQEFEGAEKLFETPPEWWTDEEKNICDYQGRVINELEAGIEKIFGRRDGAGRTKRGKTAGADYRKPNGERPGMARGAAL